MLAYLVSFVFGIYVAQEFEVPNVKTTAEDIIRRFKK